MNRIKGINVLKAELLDFAEDIMYSLSCELQRIGRTVVMTELKFNPFTEEVKHYIDAIRLDENAEVIFNTSFADVSEKLLRSCISDWKLTFLVYLICWSC